MNRATAVPCMPLCLVSIAIGLGCQERPPAGATFLQAGGYGDARTFQIALGDLDADGDLDAVFSNMHAPSEVWMNDGRGGFTDSKQRLGHECHGVGIGDLDGDGDLDVLLTPASSTAPSLALFNDGSGRFAQVDGTLDDEKQAANFVSLFDLEGDGDLDAGVYYADRYNIVYVNDGSGKFKAMEPRIAGMASWGDIDGDGDVDAVVQKLGGGYLTMFNTGDGSFKEATIVQAPSAFIPGNAALADIDNDDDLDLISANGGESLDTPVTILLNDGAGVFKHVPQERFLTSLGRVSLGDISGDGFLDVLVGCYELPDVIGINDGTGGFTDSGSRLGAGEWEGVSAIGDLDGDGDLDVFVARYDPAGPNTVWFNQMR